MESMKLKYLLLVLLFIPFVFADNPNWPMATGIGVMIAILIIALMYLVGHGFNLNEMKAMATEEFYQIIVTVLIIGAFTAGSTLANTLSSGLASTFGMPEGTTLQAAAVKMLNENIDRIGIIEVDIRKFSNEAAEEASKTSFCSLMSTSINIAGCGSYRQLSAPIALVASAFSIAAAELQSILALVNFGLNYVLTFMLPLGAFLRSFKITRGAGGLLIALGVVFYLLLPLAVVFMQQLMESFEKVKDNYKFENKPNLPKFGDNTFGSGFGECNPFSISDNEGTALKAFSIIFDKLDFYIYFIIVKITISTIISILVMVTALRYLASMFGVDIDVTALAKVA